MLRDDAIAQIKQVLGFRSDLTAAVINTMQFEQVNLEQGPTKPWFLLSEDSTTTTSPAEPRIGLPDDFLMEFEEGALFYIPSDTTQPERELVKLDYDDLKAAYADWSGEGPAEPCHYAIRGNYFILFPTPDAAYTIKMVYYKSDEVLSANIENMWLKYAPKLLMGVTGKNIAGSSRDGNAFTIFSSWEQEGRLQMFARNEDREHTNRDYQMGGLE